MTAVSASNGNAGPTTSTRTVAGATSELCTLYWSLDGRVTDARFEKMVLNSLRKLPTATLENILESRRHEEPGIANGPARLRIVPDEGA